MKKEELIKENVELEVEVERLQKLEGEERRDLCRVLGFTKWENHFGGGGESKLEVKTWAEIYAEIGRLKQRQDVLNTVEKVDRLEKEMSGHQQNWEEYFKGKRT